MNYRLKERVLFRVCSTEVLGTPGEHTPAEVISSFSDMPAKWYVTLRLAFRLSIRLTNKSGVVTNSCGRTLTEVSSHFVYYA